ncbi:MAG: hypothetical protein ACOX3V_04890 [Bacillota bacterium]|jgi:NAD(P)H-flavin reductase
MLYTPKPCVITEVIPQTYDTNTYVMEFVDEKDNAEFSCYLGQFNMLSVLGLEKRQYLSLRVLGTVASSTIP